MHERYRVQAFAELAGVTVRTLHHYDRLALLRPKRTRAGYRLYSPVDLERLEQIVALKFLGLPLRQIKAVLDRDDRALPDVLRAQRRALEEKRRRLDLAIGAIADAEQVVEPGRPAEAAVLRRIIEVIDMQDNQQAMRKYYSDEAWAELARRRELMTPDERQRIEDGTARWMALFKDVEAALSDEPASPGAQALVERWHALVAEFTQGHAGITQGLGKAWADRASWPAGMQTASQPFGDPRIWEFIRAASAARRTP